MPNTASGIWYPDIITPVAPLQSLFSTLSSSVENTVVGSVVHVFANTAVRDTYYTTQGIIRTEGMRCVVGTQRQVFTSGAWVYEGPKVRQTVESNTYSGGGLGPGSNGLGVVALSISVLAGSLIECEFICNLKIPANVDNAGFVHVTLNGVVRTIRFHNHSMSQVIQVPGSVKSTVATAGTYTATMNLDSDPLNGITIQILEVPMLLREITA